MNYAHDGRFSAKKAGGIGLTVVLHALVACGVIFSLQRTFVHHKELPPQPVTPIIEHLQPQPLPEPPLREPNRPQVVIPQMDPPPVDFNNKETQHTTTPVDITDKHNGPENRVEVPGNGTGAGTGGGEGKATVPTSSPVITNLNSCKPEYPRSSLLKEESGTVRVRFEIGADSKVMAASVVHSSGYSTLDKAAVNALSHCQFKAAQQNGEPVSSTLTTDYVWTLNNE